MKWQRSVVQDCKISWSGTYIALVVLLGSCLICRSFYLWTSDRPWLYLGFAATTLLTSAMKVSLPGIKGTISVAYIFVLLSITRFSMDRGGGASSCSTSSAVAFTVTDESIILVAVQRRTAAKGGNVGCGAQNIPINPHESALGACLWRWPSVSCAGGQCAT